MLSACAGKKSRKIADRASAIFFKMPNFGAAHYKIEFFRNSGEKMKWYIQRWNVELFHKILKSGCAVESAQLRTRNKLIKYITIKSVIAWRIFS